MRIIVTGGSGFIGSHLVKFLIKEKIQVLNLDKLTYAGKLNSLEEVSKNKFYYFDKIDICNYNNLRKVFFDFKPDGLIHLAAETHVDRSIDNPEKFLKTNIFGTFNLLEVSREYLLNYKSLKNFRFLNISTDEVFGDLALIKGDFSENSPYRPSSPYSASKASADHLVRSWGRTYNLPILITNCSNNYGPFQYPEKLIPVIIKKAYLWQKIPLYGNGKQIRNWIYVEDHIKGIWKVFKYGKIGETYNIGSDTNKTNIEITNYVCSILDRILPKERPEGKSYKELITFVSDRPGHDIKYSVSSKKIFRALDWRPEEDIKSGLNKTIIWYLKNVNWWHDIH